MLRFSPQFRQALEHLHAADREAFAGLRAAIWYLNEHRRGALAPDVKWKLAQSAFGPNSGEIRWSNPEYQAERPRKAWRGLFVTNATGEWLLFTVLGNKAIHQAGSAAWYDINTAESDRIANDYQARFPLQNFP